MTGAHRAVLPARNFFAPSSLKIFLTSAEIAIRRHDHHLQAKADLGMLTTRRTRHPERSEPQARDAKNKRPRRETVEVPKPQALASSLKDSLTRRSTSSAAGKDEPRAEKIRRIKDLVRRGEYHVAAEDVARALIRHDLMRILRQKRW
jgi:anti-sigma28 factor (negative regulator of flagellin synthesis)